jgi:DNA-binding transcriptional MerR regulator
MEVELIKTVKQVSELTGISVRTLHYYDEIGLLKPSATTKAGYRLYGNEALESLQQILFFRELGLPLKEVREIMDSPQFNKKQALERHKKLLIMKRNRLNKLIELVDKLLKGEQTVSFKEFNLSEYFDALEQFKNEHSDEVAKYWGSMDNFNEFLERTRAKESEVAAIAIKQYGSVEKYTKAMKDNMEHFSSTMEQMHSIRDNMDYYKNRSDEIYKKLTSDLSKAVSSEDIQQTVDELVESVRETNATVKIDMGENFWGLVIEGYLSEHTVIEVTDKLYGTGAAEFIGKALKYYFDNR